MGVLLVSTFMIVGTRLMWWGLLPLYLRSLGATDLQVGLTYTVMLLVQGPAHILGGMISDRWGRRYSITLPSVAFVAILLIGVSARVWLWMAVTVWLIGIVSGTQQPGLQALVAESSEDTARGWTFGGFYSIVALAQMVGPAVGASLLPVLGIRGLIWANIGFAVVAAVIRLIFLKEGPYARITTEIEPISIRDLARNPAIWQLILVNSLFLLIQSLTLQGPFVTLHAADTLALSESQINLLLAAGGIGATVASIWGGRLADRIGSRKTGAFALTGHGILLMVWALIWPVTLASFGLFTLSWILAQVGRVAYTAWFSAYAPVKVRGRILGAVGATATLISALGPQGGTYLRLQAQNFLGQESGIGGRFASGTPFVLTLLLALAFSVVIMRMPARSSALES